MYAIEVESLTKVYEGKTRAVDGITFSVDEGEIFGLLGPNGAGKTTAIKIITTLTEPTQGTVHVFGLDVRREPSRVRGMLGYVPQSVSVDGDLTAYENLLIFSKLFYVERSVRKNRIEEALEYMDLKTRANDLVKHFSGGMMRRLEIAQALVNRPRVLFLDEPSIGLDPTSKRQGWEYIRRLNREFDTTVFITTHDMAEADYLCERVAIMDRGKIAVLGRPSELKRSLGGDVLTVGATTPLALPLIPPEVGTLLSTGNGELQILTEKGETAIPKVVEFFEKTGIEVQSISLSRPDLDAVFTKYTKSRLADEAGALRNARIERRSFARHSR